EIEPPHLRELPWQERYLNLTRSLELSLNCDELCFIAKNARRHSISQTQDKHEDANWLQVDSRHDRPSEVFVDDEQHQHDRADRNGGRFEQRAESIAEEPDVRERHHETKQDDGTVGCHRRAGPTQGEVGRDGDDRVADLHLPYTPNRLLPSRSQQAFEEQPA